jgi:peptidoglycan/LPS O-acetylase OafA/YrhL
MIPLGQVAVGRDNNFNLIRMVAATGVLVSHAFPLTYGPGTPEPLERWLGFSLGYVSVMVFFALSGFLITRSFQKSASLKRFVKARVYRIYPALIAVLLVTVAVGALSVPDDWRARFWGAVPNYLLSNLALFRLHYDLPGVFMSNPYGPAINGSLWTLFYEVLCYVLVAMAGLAGALSRPRVFLVLVALFAVAFVASLLVGDLPRRVDNVLKLGFPFAIGSALAVWRDKVPFGAPVAFALAGAALLAAPFAVFPAVFAVALAYGVLWLGHLRVPALLPYNRLGDYSYGTYIYAFPVQQSVAALGVTSPWINIALALPVTLFCAVLSWTFVEAPALTRVRSS